MFARLLVVFLVELADQFFEHITHAEVAQTRHRIAFGVFDQMWCQVDVGRDELFQNVQQNLLVGHVAHLFQQLKALDDLFDVVAEPVQIILHVCQQDLLVVRGGGMQLLQRPFAGVEKYVTRGGLEGRIVQFGGLHLVLLEADLSRTSAFVGSKRVSRRRNTTLAR